MKKILLTLALSAFASLVHAAGYQITAEQWASPRSGQSVAAMAPLPEVVAQLQAKPRAKAVLYHPGGDEGLLWAQELLGWLVALGIPSHRIELMPGNPHDDTIEITIKNTGGNP